MPHNLAGKSTEPFFATAKPGRETNVFARLAFFIVEYHVLVRALGNDVRGWHDCCKQIDEVCLLTSIDQFEKMQNQQLATFRDKQLGKGTEIGYGGQGTVRRINSGTGVGPIAFKVFSPRLYSTVKEYRLDMSRIKRVVDRLASIRQNNLLDQCSLLDYDGIYIMLMEHVDGYDRQKYVSV